jgi:hypothetical protein
VNFLEPHADDHCADNEQQYLAENPNGDRCRSATGGHG